MIILWYFEQSWPFQPWPNLCHTDRNDDILCQKYDVKNEKYLCLKLLLIVFCTKFYVKTFTKMFLQFLEFSFY